MSDQTSTSTYLNKLSEQIEQLMVLLTQKERYVIEKRFNLDNKKRFTLEEIGKHFSVTRERIRQIEKNALHKLRRNIEKFDINAINQIAYQFLSENGGMMKADLLLSKLLSENDNLSISGLILVMSLDKRFEYLNNTIHYHPYFKLNTISTQVIEKISDKAYVLLKQKSDLAPLSELAREILQSFPDVNYSNDFFASLFTVNKSFKLVDSKVGLLEWRHVNPRTLRDKIYYILRKNKKPMHFVGIANSIMEAGFDRKNLNLQAIHNELIRHNDFVLIGRGIYALSEWGYSHGTVADVIMEVLAKADSLSEEQIIDEVMKRRQVKPITIILNLKNKSQFIRVGRKQYTLKK